MDMLVSSRGREAVISDALGDILRVSVEFGSSLGGFHSETVWSSAAMIRGDICFDVQVSTWGLRARGQEFVCHDFASCGAWSNRR